MPHLRMCRDDDFAAIAALTNEFIRSTAVHFGDVEQTPDELRALAGARVGGTTYPWLVAEDDSGFLGYAKASSWRARAAYAWTAETTIYLHATQRRRGLGRALYARLLATLRAQGFRSAIGGITLPNPASVRLHEALGFEPCGVVREAGNKFGRWHDVGFWQLRLRDDAQAPGALLTPAQAFAATAGSA